MDVADASEVRVEVHTPHHTYLLPPPKNPNFMKAKCRSLSFTRCENPLLLSKNNDFIRAGFYFIPQNEKRTDTLCCFQCGIKLQNWLPSDDPYVQHHRYSKNCDYLNMVDVIGCNLN